ncbi:MAG: tyrosine protein phosphatase [Leptolyngbyaceae cyanobacterium CSU_1_3]|nr:tyrosine protein phosphatase [Leptolyngbyaceae cyanobacterium CSU_1_3]
MADEIRQWQRNGIEIVISLLTPRESSELGLSQEAVVTSQQGIQFLSFPIPDRAVPASLRAMRAFTEKVAALLWQGKRVAIHCRQGVGRSALLAATLLVNAGVEVEQAFAQIEEIRGVSVPDTLEQRQWVEKFAHTTAVPAF